MSVSDCVCLWFSKIDRCTHTYTHTEKLLYIKILVSEIRTQKRCDSLLAVVLYLKGQAREVMILYLFIVKWRNDSHSLTEL